MFSVIFDMDGTLLDTQRIFISAWDYAGQKQGFENMGKFIPDVCGMNKIGSDNYLKTNFPTLELERFRDDSREYIGKNLVVRYMPGAEELLNYLKSRGVKVALASGTSRPSVEHHLKEVGAFEKFDAIVCGTEVKNGKPDPDIFLETARQLGVKPSECFVFEDSSNGIKAGYNAGMKCIGVPDVVQFGDNIKKLMYCELENIGQAIELFEKEQ